MNTTDGPPVGSTVLRTCDLDEAQQVVSGVYVPHRLTAAPALDVRLDLVDSDRLTFGYLTYGARAQLDVPPMLDCYHVNLTLTGNTSVRHGSTTTRTRAGHSGVVLSPTLPSIVRWSSDAAQFAVKVPVPVLVEQLSALLHDAVDAPPEFNGPIDLLGVGVGVLPAARFLASQFGTGARLDSLVRRQTESYLLTQLLLGAEHDYSARLISRTNIGRHAFEEAVDYVEAYPDEVLGLAELAAVAGTTATALQAAFEHQLGLSVDDYVRGVRLTRVHAELLRDGGGNVHALAARWGFSDAADLRAAYRRQYGAEIDGDSVNPR